VSLLTEVDDMQVLKQFYIKTRPWGFWKPVLDEIRKDHPNVQPNQNVVRDLSNVLVGVVWHSGLIAAPIFLVIQQFLPMTVALGIVIVASIYLKINWWNKMEDYPDDMPELNKTEGTVF
jgi:hypothetical protein